MAQLSSFQINMDFQCHENLDHMEKTLQGRFCTSCQKNVTDFTKMSNDELIKFMKETQFKNACGRFTQQQLLQTFYAENPKPYINLSSIRKWAAAFFLLPAYTQQIAAMPKGRQMQSQMEALTEEKKEIKIVIEGVVRLIDENIPIPDCKVSIHKDTVITDANGKFRFYLPATMINDSVLIKTKMQNGLVADDYKLHIGNYISYNQEIVVFASPNVNIAGATIDAYYLKPIIDGGFTITSTEKGYKKNGIGRRFVKWFSFLKSKKKTVE